MEEKFGDFRDLLAYKKSFKQGCLVFELTLSFPFDEKYSLSDQIKRSSRSVSANLAEAYRKRDYLKHFLLKITDCMGENSETLVWLDYAKAHHYLTDIDYNTMLELNDEITKLLKYMYNNPGKFGVNTND